MTTDPVGVVDAELVDEEPAPLPAVPAPAGRPLVDRHTMLRPGAPLPTDDDAPTYTERDLYVSEATAQLLDDAPPPNTSTQYRSAWNRFTAWCDQEGRVALPCTTATLVEYVGHLIRQDRAPSTIRVAMSAIRSRHRDDQQPGTREAGKLLRAHARTRARAGRTPRQAPGITTELLERLVATCDAETGPRRLAGVRDAALLTVGWGMLARRSELAALTIEQVRLEAGGVEVFVAMSKTDQQADGETTWVPAVPDQPTVCPVVRVGAWLAALRERGITTGPLLRTITHGGTLPHARGLSPRSVGDLITARARAADVPDPSRITAHGLRRGAAQYLADRGQDPTGQGRWQQGSRTVERHYLAPARGRDRNPFTAARRQDADGT